jgi:glucose-1-phosphate cytidylyltransferase
MQAVILAGGLGSRLSEETHLRPKPMVEIGGRPILWHIMQIYSTHGIRDFVICVGYKGYVIKEFFANYLLHSSDVTFSLAENRVQIHDADIEQWTVTVVETGQDTQTGGRLKRALPYVTGEFCFTYGDGVGDVDITALVEFHRKQGRLATVTGVQPPGRFGALELTDDDQLVHGFREKPEAEGGLISGGFFVLSPTIGSYIEGDETVWELEPMERLAAEGQLSCYQHSGFWQPMDTLRERNLLENLWTTGKAPWKVWQGHNGAAPHGGPSARAQLPEAVE